jgi:hypothetical protein
MGKRDSLHGGAGGLDRAGPCRRLERHGAELALRHALREPFNPSDIKKHVFALTHASGYKYGATTSTSTCWNPTAAIRLR